MPISSITDNNSDTESSDDPPPIPDKCSDYSNVSTSETPPIPSRVTTHRKSKVSFSWRRIRASTASLNEKEEHTKHSHNKNKHNG